MFIHLPRTGGTAVQRHLEATAGPGAVWRVGLPPDFLDDLDRLRSAQVVVGHFFYPMVTLVSRAVVATVLREPVERAISVWEYLNWQTHHPHHPLLAERGITDIQAFATDPFMYAHVSNVQTRMLGADCDLGGVVAAFRSGEIDLDEARRRASEPASAVVDDAMLERAKQRLRDMLLVGVTESLQEFAYRLNDRMGLPRGSALPSENTSPDEILASRGEAYDDGARRLLAEINGFDAELYALARELWLKQAS